MNKPDMLEKLGTNEDEWNSYLAKYKAFVTKLPEGEKMLHAKLAAQKCPPLLENATIEEIGNLFGEMKEIDGFAAHKNTCSGCIKEA